jgi:hypothetical protein
VRYLPQGTVLSGFQQALETVLLAFAAFMCKDRRRDRSSEATEQIQDEACAVETPLAHVLIADANACNDAPIQYLAENLERQLDNTRLEGACCSWLLLLFMFVAALALTGFSRSSSIV